MNILLDSHYQYTITSHKPLFKPFALIEALLVTVITVICTIINHYIYI